ncbi:MAG: DUF1801 domain-containing protein [Flavobacteriales bacterium]|nr:DUF1801 domain-containing protein [Flavobacteriales bacterium]
MRQRTATTNRQAQSPEVRPTMLAGGLRFATVQECLDFLPPDGRALTGELRELLVQEAPELKERISFNVPFYKVRRDICFLWPASVLWGNRKTYDGVRVGFSYGHLLTKRRRPFGTRRPQAGVLARTHRAHARR